MLLISRSMFDVFVVACVPIWMTFGALEAVSKFNDFSWLLRGAQMQKTNDVRAYVLDLWATVLLLRIRTTASNRQE